MPFSRLGNEIVSKGLRRAQQRNNGQAPSLTRVAAQGIAARAVGDLTSLPAAGDDEKELFTEAGNPIFILGYSALDGGDVLG